MCTGLPDAPTTPKCDGGVYPRVYGATGDADFLRDCAKGLSPCVRGYRPLCHLWQSRSGSIPVCTGLPGDRLHRRRAPRVYPRVYGATRWSAPACGLTWGLSPCVRGYLEQIKNITQGTGSIPVCTGLPIFPLLTFSAARVYPRVYGATDLPPLDLQRRPGLSPCVRGYRAGSSGKLRFLGSIPVCTGLPRQP